MTEGRIYLWYWYCFGCGGARYSPSNNIPAAECKCGGKVYVSAQGWITTGELVYV